MEEGARERKKERGVAGISIGGDTFISRSIKNPDNQKLVKMIYNLPSHLTREFLSSSPHEVASRKEL